MADDEALSRRFHRDREIHAIQIGAEDGLTRPPMDVLQPQCLAIALQAETAVNSINAKGPLALARDDDPVAAQLVRRGAGQERPVHG